MNHIKYDVAVHQSASLLSLSSQPMCTVQLKSAKLVLLNACATWACITTFILKQELCVINFHEEGSTQRHATPLILRLIIRFCALYCVRIEMLHLSAQVSVYSVLV